jgi:hypothetical protein
VTDETPIEPVADPAADGQPTVEQAALAAEAVTAAEPLRVPSPASSAPALPDERPELLVGAAFAGGLALALLLKRLAR